MSWPWVVAFVGLWIFVLVLGMIVLGLVRRVSAFLERAESNAPGLDVPSDFGGLVPGDRVPQFELWDRGGSRIDSSVLLASPVVLMFMDPGCGPCEDLVRLIETTEQPIDGAPYVIVTEDTEEATKFRFPPGATVLYQRDRSVSTAFKNIAAPQAFAIARQIVLGKTVPESVEALSRLAALASRGGDMDELGSSRPRHSVESGGRG